MYEYSQLGQPTSATQGIVVVHQSYLKK